MLGRDDVELLSSSQTFTTAVQTQLLLPLVVEYETPVSEHFLISVFVFFLGFVISVLYLTADAVIKHTVWCLQGYISQ